MSEKKINNPFIGRNDGLKYDGSVLRDENYSEVIEVARVEKTGEGESDFVVIRELRPQNIVPLQDYIAQFQDDVGILNVLRKVAKTGDVSVLQSLKDDGKPGLDMTVMPKDYIEAAEMKQKADAMYAKLPDEIRDKFSKDDLLTITQGAFAAYIASLKESSKETIKENEVNKNV